MRMSAFEGTSIYFFSFVKFDRHKTNFHIYMHSCSLCVREVDLSEAGGSILTHMYIYRKILGEGIIFSFCWYYYDCGRDHSPLYSCIDILHVLFILNRGADYGTYAPLLCVSDTVYIAP